MRVRLQRRRQAPALAEPPTNFPAGDKVEKLNRPFPSGRGSWIMAIRSAAWLRIDDCSKWARFD
jgi:hypothetical protein